MSKYLIVEGVLPGEPPGSQLNAKLLIPSPRDLPGRVFWGVRSYYDVIGTVDLETKHVIFGPIRVFKKIFELRHTYPISVIKKRIQMRYAILPNIVQMIKDYIEWESTVRPFKDPVAISYTPHYIIVFTYKFSDVQCYLEPIDPPRYKHYRIIKCSKTIPHVPGIVPGIWDKKPYYFRISGNILERVRKLGSSCF